MTTFPDRCPYCNAPKTTRKHPYDVKYDCGTRTVLGEDNPPLARVPTCYINEVAILKIALEGAAERYPVPDCPATIEHWDNCPYGIDGCADPVGVRKCWITWELGCAVEEFWRKRAD